MKKSRVKQKLGNDEPVLVITSHITHPTVYEMTTLMGFDCIWMDMEHHAYSLETAESMMRIARLGGTDIAARPAKGEFMRMGRMLEAGAQGIIYPRCDDAEEAKEVVKWSKFYPLGKRGVDGGSPDAPYCSMNLDKYVKIANEEMFVVIQLEEQHAIDNAEAIASVEGVDVIHFGFGDYTVQSGFPGDFNHPRVQESAYRISRVAKNAGKHWGMPFITVEDAKTGIEELGARFIMHGADIVLLKAGLEKIQKDFVSIGMKFDNKLDKTCENCL